MKRECYFWSVFAVVLTAYILSAADCVVPEARFGRYPILQYWVKFFGDPILMTSIFAAFTSAVIARVTSIYLGWRVGVFTSFLFAFMPGIWNCATRGESWAFPIAIAGIELLFGNAIGLWVFRKAIAVHTADIEDTGKAFSKEEVIRRRKSGIVSWFLFAAGIIFALASLTFHEFDFGKAAKLYAKDVVDAANGRWIVLSGVANEEIKAELKARDGTSPIVELTMDDEYRQKLVKVVTEKFPDDAGLKMAAQVSPSAFVEMAVKKYPDRFYMVAFGGSYEVGEKYDRWLGRWNRAKVYLGVEGDPFIRTMRRAFAYEGNSIGNALREANNHALAWKTYDLIAHDMETDNLSTLVNMSEMIRRGYEPGEKARKFLKIAMANFFKDKFKAEHAREMVAQSGPVLADEALVKRLKEETLRRIKEMELAGKPLELSHEAKRLLEWNDEMVMALNDGNGVKAGRIARTILSNPKWRNFIPANAVLGSYTCSEGDYQSAEMFFRLAVATTNRIPAVTCNDFSETLRHLGKFEESEMYARKAVESSSPKFWMARMTLAEVLLATGKNPVETRKLLDEAAEFASPAAKIDIEALRKKL